MATLAANASKRNGTCDWKLVYPSQRLFCYEGELTLTGNVEVR